MTERSEYDVPGRYVLNMEEFQQRRFSKGRRVIFVLMNVWMFALGGLMFTYRISEGDVSLSSAVIGGVIGGVLSLAYNYAVMRKAIEPPSHALPMPQDDDAIRLAPAIFEDQFGWLALKEDSLRFYAKVSYKNLDVKLSEVNRVRAMKQFLNGRPGIRFHVGRRQYFYEVFDGEEWAEEINERRRGNR